MKKLMMAAVLLLAPAFVAAQTFDPSKVVVRSSATANLITLAATGFTIMDTASIRMEGSDFILVQSTYAAGAFCCSFDAAASADLSTAKGCVAARKDNGGGFYEIAFRRWWQNLQLRCASLDSATAQQVLRVFQSK